MSTIGSTNSVAYSPFISQQQQLQQLQQSLLNTNSNSSITNTEFEQELSGAGGTAPSSDPLLGMLDPGGASSPASSSYLSGSPYSDQVGAQLVANQSQPSSGANASGAAAGTPDLVSMLTYQLSASAQAHQHPLSTLLPNGSTLI